MFGLSHAPDLTGSRLRWFNVERPLSLEDLRGRLVILDFWTFCCINCMHVLSTLKVIEETFPEEVVVIGIHSPKFEAERDAANVAQAIARYDIRHPVVHDPEMTLWRAYCVRAWPTLLFLSPDGMIIGSVPGEPDRLQLTRGIGKMLGDWKDKGMMAPKRLALRRPTKTDGLLRFPGKIKPLREAGDGKLWAVADSGHHQIVILDDDGCEVRRFGGGEAGFIDSDAANSAFHSPQGLICGAGVIYVADTGNHAIRLIDLEKDEIITLAGTGERGMALCGPAPGSEAVLASVWDLELAGERLFFANAGTHQLGELDLASNQVRPLAGTSGEDIIDGPSMEALLAQPSGLALDGKAGTLYFADSETSSVRALNLKSPSRVDTLVGTGLLDFGAINGPFETARLQHPLGLTWIEGALVVADSYNNRLRVLSFNNRQVNDLGENRFTCADNSCLAVSEPAGVAADGNDRLLLADTNNHRVVEIRRRQETLSVWAE
ncbi:MAG: thioredoxin-like domain-containing protein [Rhodospirillales bacterium]